uniref:Putative ovule protein n=1 Tax=Solanum chacoense TaxID=4108 RepID=A0A0V0GKU7_SOLCH
MESEPRVEWAQPRTFRDEGHQTLLLMRRPYGVKGAREVCTFPTPSKGSWRTGQTQQSNVSRT